MQHDSTKGMNTAFLRHSVIRLNQIPFYYRYLFVYAMQRTTTLSNQTKISVSQRFRRKIYLDPKRMQQKNRAYIKFEWHVQTASYEFHSKTFLIVWAEFDIKFTKRTNRTRSLARTHTQSKR